MKESFLCVCLCVCVCVRGFQVFSKWSTHSILLRLLTVLWRRITKKEEPYLAPIAHGLCTGTFAKPSFISSRPKAIQAKRPGTSDQANGTCVCHSEIPFGNFGRTFKKSRFPVETSVREEKNSLSIYFPSEISGFWGEMVNNLIYRFRQA